MQNYADTIRNRLSYGALAAPLALVGLPLYVYLPSLFAQLTGLSLVAVGTILLAARATEAVADPWIGHLIHRIQTADAVNKRQHVALYAGLAAVLLAISVWACLNAAHWAVYFATPTLVAAALTACVGVAYLCYSWLTVTHHTVGTALIAQGMPSTGLYSVREALALAGVLVGSVLPLLSSWAAYAWVCAAMLALGYVWVHPYFAALRAHTDAPSTHALTQDVAPNRGFSLWQDIRLKRLWWAFFVSNVSGSLPATLLGFYVADVLGLGADSAPRYLAIYFIAAALGFAAWPKLADRFGATRVWRWAMAGNGVVFASAAFLSITTPQVSVLYGAVCFSTGLLLGAELMLPQAIVAKHLVDIGQPDHAARVFAWWTFAQKTALAMAAGFGLWGLAALGYVPGQSSSAAPLMWFYCIVPCMLKLLAASITLSINEKMTQAPA